MATLKDIAKACDVSVSTVSRVLKGDKTLKVNQDTKEMIFACATKLDYKIKSRATSGNKVAVINWYSHDQEVIDPYYFYIRKGIINRCLELNIKYDIYFKEDDISSLFDYDAIIAVGKFSQKNVLHLSSFNKYLIFVDSNPDINNYDSVEVDFDYVIYDIFTKLKTKDIILLNGCEYLDGIKYEDPRLIAYKKHCKLNDILPSFIEGEFSMQSGYDMIYNLDKIPNTIICGNDLIAMGANKALSEKGYIVGDDVYLIGINDIPVSHYMVPTLTTISIDQQQMGIEAVNLVNRKLNEDSNTNIRVLVPTKYIKRDSH